MTAIYGLLGAGSDAEIAQMHARLAHRGGRAESVAPDRDVRLGMLAQALSLPQQLAEGIVFSGNLIDPSVLATRLGWKHDAVLAAPIAALRELYRRDGASAFGALDGPYALALWDEGNRAVVLARDRFGAKSLYYTRSEGGRWCFASEYKALLALPDVPARPDLDAIQELHYTKYKPVESLLRDVRSVPCGGGVVLTQDGAQRFRYWTPTVEIARRSESEHVAAVRDALRAATQRQSHSYSRLGVALSGGLDSTVVLASLRSVAPDRPIHAFTGVWGPEDPECAAAAEAARTFGAEHHVVVLKPSELAEILPRVIWHIEDPVGREDNPYLYVTAREAARYVDVLFAGYSADLLFGGMPRHKLLNAAYKLPPFRNAFRDLLGYAQRGRAPSSALGALLVGAWYRGKQYPPPRVIGASEQQPLPPLEPRGEQPLTEYLARSLHEYPGKAHLDNLHAAFGLRFNTPFIDTRFMEVAFTLPDALKIRRLTQDKYALRAASAELIPATLRRRRKTLQRMRHDAQLCDVLDAFGADLLSPEQVRARGLFDPDYVARALRRPKGGVYPSEQFYRVWSLVTTELWARSFLDARGAAPSA